MKKKFLPNAAILLTGIYMLWRIFRTIPFGYGVFPLICGLILLLVEAMGMFESIVHFRQLSNIKYPKKKEIPPQDMPEVDIFISTYNEPPELLYKTINGCKHMDYPDKSKVHIYLCDDGHREEMGKLCAEMGGVTHLTRETHKDAKAGNLNYALSVTHSPFIVTFDADMIPRSDFLTACIPYMLSEEKVGFLQTPQTFYNPDLFQYNLYQENRMPNEQDYFYRDVQVARNRSNTVIYGGTNTIISRQALEEVGGIVTGVITEDFATGVRIQSKGYQCYAISDSHASGLAPEDLESLVKQRQRWARGCIQTGRKIHILLNKSFSFWQKASYLSSITYWYGAIKRFVYFMSPILFSVFGIIVLKCTIGELLLFWGPMYAFNTWALKSNSNNIRNVRWTNVYDTILFPSLFFPVILERLGITMKKFNVTKKDGEKKTSKAYQYKCAFPLAVFWLLTAIGVGKTIYMMFMSGEIGGIIILFWLLVNLYNLTMGLFFMLGRPFNRKTERFDVKLKCELEIRGKKIQTETKDISEDGISVVLDIPVYIEAADHIKVLITDRNYRCEWTGQIANVTTLKENWRYGIRIESLSKENKEEWMQIVYDRIPTLPQYMAKDDSSVDGLMRNLFKRMKKQESFSRILPRVPINLWMRTEAGTKVLVKDFNYEYLAIRNNGEASAGKKGIVTEMIIPVTEKIKIKCTKGIKFRDNRVLYRVENTSELGRNPDFEDILKSWILSYRKNKAEEYEFKKSMISQELKEEFDSEMQYL